MREKLIVFLLNMNTHTHTHTFRCYGNIKSKNDTPNNMVPRHNAIISYHNKCASAPEYGTPSFFLFSVFSLKAKGADHNGNQMPLTTFFSGSLLHEEVL